MVVQMVVTQRLICNQGRQGVEGDQLSQKASRSMCNQLVHTPGPSQPTYVSICPRSSPYALHPRTRKWWSQVRHQGGNRPAVRQCPIGFDLRKGPLEESCSHQIPLESLPQSSRHRNALQFKGCVTSTARISGSASMECHLRQAF